MHNHYGDEDGYEIPDFSPQKSTQQKPVGIPEYDGIHGTPEKAPIPVSDSKNVAGYLTAASGQQYFLKPGINVIGRGDVDFVLKDKTVSRRHCVIDVDISRGRGNYQYELYDIGCIDGHPSKNGVYVVGRTPPLGPAEKVYINNGSRIVVGTEELTLHSHA